MSAKGYFRSIGIEHVSIDKVACHKALKLDLRKPLDKKFHNYFDIVTNSGTTEHIKPLEGQYEAFKNIHVCAKKGAIILHILPTVKKYLGHCQAYYSYDFFRNLAKLNNYEIIALEDVKNRETIRWIGVCYRKLEDNDFTVNKKEFFKGLTWVDKETFKKHRKNKKKYYLA